MSVTPSLPDLTAGVPSACVCEWYLRLGDTSPSVYIQFLPSVDSGGVGVWTGNRCTQDRSEVMSQMEVDVYG